MKIPIIQSETKVPSTTYPVEPSGLLAQAGASQRVQGLINTIVEEQGRILEKQKAINQATEISQAEIDVENENQKLIENLKRSPNPEKYYSDWQAGYQDISKNRLAQIKDPETRGKANITFQKMMAQDMVQQSHYGNMLWLSTKRGQIERLSDEYIKNGQPEKAIELVENGILGGLFTPEEGEKEIIGIKDKAEKKVKENNYANALNMIMVDPSEETLNKAIKLFDIPTERQAELRRQQRIERDAQERQNEREIKLKHDEQDQAVADLYLNRQYSKAYVLAQSSKFLSADERRGWGNSIDAKVKQTKETTEDNPRAFYNHLQKVLDPSLTEEAKQKEANSIITDLQLKDETKKTLLRDLVKDQLFLDPWFKRSEKSIKEALGWTEMMGFLNLENPTVAESSYTEVVRQLITDIKKEGLKGEEIDKRARQLVLPKQMEIWDMMMGGKKSEKKEKPKEKYDIGTIYTDAQGRKAKYLGAGKWEMVK